MPGVDGGWGAIRASPPSSLGAKKPLMATRKKPSTPPEKVLTAGLERDTAKYLYYVDKQCNVVRMERGVARARTEVVLVTGLKREKGWGYFLDDDGDVSREPE